MSERWVVDGSTGWLNARATYINWSQEIERAQYSGPVAHYSREPCPVQLRWMLNPRIGLPFEPFTIWANPDPDPGNLSKQELANLPGWIPGEIVGLPVDENWAAFYSNKDQGPVGALLPLSPMEAALRRIEVGAPLMGWNRFFVGGVQPPDWQPPDAGKYLSFVTESRMMCGIAQMLSATQNASEHFSYRDTEEPRRDSTLMPHLIIDNSVAFADRPEAASSEWHPLRLLALTAGSDPYAALALGFGTAVNVSERDPDTMLMVSVRHRLYPNAPEIEIADIMWPFRPLRPPRPTSGLAARRISHTPPQRLDGPSLDSIGVSWNRPPNPAYAVADADEPYPVSYAVARFGPEPGRSDLLITPRPEDVGGWTPFVASQVADVRPILFPHHLVRTTALGHPDIMGGAVIYAVAAQDLFGRWSAWRTVSFATSTEAPQIPRIVSVTLSTEGKIKIDLAWDWSDRSPQFIELTGAYADNPGATVIAARLDFAGTGAPASNPAAIIALDQAMQPAAGWGAAQDAPASAPGTRYYRLTASVPITFASESWRDFEVRARGQCRLHHDWFPGGWYNISAFGPPTVTRILDPKPPDTPGLPEAPQWASLPDATGVSRALLSWQNVERAKGYAIYEATETALLSALGKTGPDTSAPFTDRLAVLRAANLPALRHVFRRIEPELTTPAAGRTSFETALLRGSRVMHFFAVTAINENNVESTWPKLSKHFAAFAVPRLRVPPPPLLEAVLDTTAPQPVVKLGIDTGHSIPGGSVEIFRATNDRLTASLDLMGPPIVTLTAETPIHLDAGITPGWQRIWYRAQSWSARDDQNGWVEARSASSPPISVVLTAKEAPTITDIRVNELGSTAREALVSWVTSAPYLMTPLGPHLAVIEARSMAGNLLARLAGDIDALDHLDIILGLPHSHPTDRRIIRVGQGADYRLYAWLPRPAIGEPFRIEMKVIDPLGRIGLGRANVLAPPLPDPEISSISPLFGWRNSSFTISGRNFIVQPSGTVFVTLEFPWEPLELVSVSATEIVATVPPDRLGSFHVTVTRGDGAETVSAMPFTIVDPIILLPPEE